MNIRILPDALALAHAAAADFVKHADQAISRRGRFNVALTGGTTPELAYRLLGSEPYAQRVDWSKVHIFWGDERCVPPGHADSNYGMARRMLLDHVPVADDHVHRMRGEAEPHAAAAAYQQLLMDNVGEGFDLIHLGMGADAHIASLFPGSAALAETERLVCAQYASHLESWRITMTPPTLNNTDFITFIVAGAAKAGAVARVLEGEFNPHDAPAQIIAPPAGEVLWLLDVAAAAQLRRERTTQRG